MKPHVRRRPFAGMEGVVRRILSAALGIWLLCGTTAAFAQATAPERAGRLSYVEGSVSVQSPGLDGWAPAQVNLPVTTGSALWTEPGARAEVQVGAASLRIDSETELSVARLDDQALEVAVSQGAVNLHRPTISDGPIWVDTPNGPVILAEPGFYRLTSQGVERAEGNPTAFDRWAMAREATESNALAETLRYVSPQTTGYQDLAANGSWTVTPQYGAVWYPRAVPVGWVPYRYGHWSYVLPWGWTWIDDAPWGFAPFHYGSWIVINGRWGWWPGPRHVRPVYVPAHVVIVAGGRDRHAPPARWIPLAPHERQTRVAVNVRVDVNRFVNRAAISSASPRMVERSLQHRDAAAPRGVRHDPDRRDQPVRAAIAAPVTAAPAVHAQPTRPQPSRLDSPREERRQRVETQQGNPPARAAMTPRPAAPQAAAPQVSAPARGSERPQPPATWRRDPTNAGERRAPEARVAPPTAAPEVQPRLGAPARIQREAGRDQRGAARAEAVAPSRPVALPQVQRPQPASQAPRAQPTPQAQRELRREPPQVRQQGSAPARAQAAPTPRAPQAAPPAARRDGGGRHERREAAPKGD
jgi:hypothetical protein